MAGLNTDEIVVGANGNLWVAPLGTTAPADESVAPGAGWVDLGYASEDGATFADAKTAEPINVWQSFYAVRRIVTERDFTVSFTLRQWNADTVALAFGGGTVTEPSAGHYMYEPPTPETLDERSFMLDWLDGANNFRLVVPRCIVSESVETNAVRNAAADLPITLSVLGDDANTPWYLLSDAAGMAP